VSKYYVAITIAVEPLNEFIPVAPRHSRATASAIHHYVIGGTSYGSS
jgi:hypothetical protein